MKRLQQPGTRWIGDWRPGVFHLAGRVDLRSRTGWLRGGLGMDQRCNASRKGRSPPLYGLTHLGSGHSVCFIEMPEAEAFAMADQVFALGDWSFEGLYGWRNTAPGLVDRFRSLLTFVDPRKVYTSSGGPSHEKVRVVAEARA